MLVSISSVGDDELRQTQRHVAYLSLQLHGVLVVRVMWRVISATSRVSAAHRCWKIAMSSFITSLSVVQRWRRRSSSIMVAQNCDKRNDSLAVSVDWS